MKQTVFFIIACLVFFTAAFPVSAQNASAVDDKIRQLQEKIGQLQSQEGSLSKEIGILSNSIELTNLQIAAKKGTIAKLEVEIQDISQQIERIEENLRLQIAQYQIRIPYTYKSQVTPQFGVMLLTDNIEKAIYRAQFFSRMQKISSQNLIALKKTQNGFAQQKDLRESKKSQQESLKNELVADYIKLDSQKKQKQQMLTDTKNSEAVYKTLLAQAMAEKQAIEKAIINSTQVGPVKKGDPIALFGNSGYPGCSTGPHLHFEVRQSGSWVNAESYLSGRDVGDDQNGGTSHVGSGSWDWPLEGDIVITQRYGKTPYSWRYSYSGGIHTGVDMISNTSTVIRAPADGTLYSSSESCGSGSIIKIKYIEHGNGTTSFYLHVQ